MRGTEPEGAAAEPSIDCPLLAIDTSSEQGAVALWQQNTVSFRSWPAGRSHTTTLLNEIHGLLSSASLDVSDLAAVGVATGPGTFTGLRAGFGVAKGFYLATGVPIIGLSTLEATALPLAPTHLPIVATLRAGRGRLVWSTFLSDESGKFQGSPPRNGAIDELAEELADGGLCIVAGELDDEQAAILASLPNVGVPAAVLRVRNPAAFIALMRQRWQRQDFDDPVAIEPTYLSRGS